MAKFYKMFRCIGAFEAEKELTGHTHCVNTRMNKVAENARWQDGDGDGDDDGDESKESEDSELTVESAEDNIDEVAL